MKKRKAYRGHRRHPQPCYCLRCESGEFDDYLEKKQRPTKEELEEIDSGSKLSHGAHPMFCAFMPVT